jgi:hypothetical protein
MSRLRVSWLKLPAAVLVASAVMLPAQEPPVLTNARLIPPDAIANRIIDDMQIPTTPNAPFSGKSVATLTQTRRGSTLQFGFFSLVARQSSGKMYFENRRFFPASGDPQPRSYFIFIDPGEHTRTICYVSTKTCRINAFRRVSYADSEPGDEASPASATESVNLGTTTIESFNVVGTRETTTIAAGAYGNHRPIVTSKEVWHSPDLDLDISITRTDPRWGAQTRKITEISRGEPDPEYFSIPADYKLLDNRPSTKQ